MNRRTFIKQAGAGIIAIGLSGCGQRYHARTGATKNGTRPNVVLVMTDDQGYGDIAAHGNPHIRTPNLDRLWAESVRLTDFHVDPTCAPTRAALLTGRYSSRTGVWHTIMGRSMLHADEVTMADMFKAGGYATGIFGKWHLGDNYPFRPQDRGFDEVLVHGGGGVTQLPDYWGNDYFDDTYRHNGILQSYTGYCTDVWFDGAMQFIEANKDRPFFCYIPTNSPHGPYNVLDAYSNPYRNNPKVPNANFYGMITNIDDNMAKLRTRLKDLGLEQNTILIFMTDNGTAAGFSKGKGFNDRMRGTKGSQYDGGHRVPCFIHWPDGKLTGGRDIDILCGHIDLFPTLTELCWIKSPDVKLDGISIVPHLHQEVKSRPQRTLFVHSQRIEKPEKWRTCAVMTEQWRLINGKELYDIQADPSQKNDIAGEHPTIVQKLRNEYDHWWESISDRFDGYCEIVLGTKHENPSRLTSHDWHTNDGPVPWNQGAVRNAMQANGFWAVQIDRAGSYRFELRRWPKEVDLPIRAAMVKAKAIEVVRARIRIAGVDETKVITGDEKGVVFTVSLPAGSTQLQTWFIESDGSSRGAYFVYVERL
ncbi:MAG: arylsulfatase [Sedimentisphaerales bacterium]|nr:arylsulfatase [Sedimentisphaerales bacterium]